MQEKPANNLDGIRDLINHLDDYYDRIVAGEVNWVELLESCMTPGALEIKKAKERKVSK